MNSVNNTQEFYARIVAINGQLSIDLFDDVLPPPLFTLGRASRSLAHYVSNRWREETGKSNGEICLNPTLFAQHSWLRLMQSVTEQLCHHWQHLYGNPGRPGYHNREWANKLEGIGLMPSSTGLPGGRRTGQIMSSYPLADGRFIDTCARLAETDFHLPLTGIWTDHPLNDVPHMLKLSHETACRLLAPVGSWSGLSDADAAIINRENKRKLKYRCPKCGASVWGKTGLLLDCRVCMQSFEAVPNRTAVHTRHSTPAMS